MKQSKGYIEIVVVFAVVLVGYMTWSYLQSVQHREVFNAWTRNCYDLNGEVKITGSNFYDCYVNNKPCVIHGYEKYQDESPAYQSQRLSFCTDKQVKS